MSQGKGLEAPGGGRRGGKGVGRSRSLAGRKDKGTSLS